MRLLVIFKMPLTVFWPPSPRPDQGAKPESVGKILLLRLVKVGISTCPLKLPTNQPTKELTEGGCCCWNAFMARGLKKQKKTTSTICVPFFFSFWSGIATRSGRSGGYSVHHGNYSTNRDIRRKTATQSRDKSDIHCTWRRPGWCSS